MAKGDKVVLVSLSGFSEKHRGVLERLVHDEIELFCAVGKDCKEWEDAMDGVCLDLDINGLKPGAFCTTTSHPDESVDEVLQFAMNWSEGNPNPIIIEI